MQDRIIIHGPRMADCERFAREMFPDKQREDFVLVSWHQNPASAWSGLRGDVVMAPGPEDESGKFMDHLQQIFFGMTAGRLRIAWADHKGGVRT